MRAFKSLTIAMIIASAATAASADTITNGFTFAVADGNHYHSSTGGDFGNPAGKAEVGRYSSEIVHGLSEYDLTGLSAASTAFVTFDIFQEGGLFAGTNDTPFTGSISVYAYQGNNAEDLSDFSALSVATVGVFFLSPGTNDVGDVFSFDITSVFNDAIANGWSSLGIRLEQNPVLSSSQAWTFDTFRLTTDDQSSTPAVPEPATWAMMIGGFGLIGASLRRRNLSSAVSFS